MKKYVLILLLLFLPALAGAAGQQKFAFPFLGRWQPTENPVLVDDYGFADIQNLRRDGNHLESVKGMQVVNSGATIDATYFYPRAGFHFTKNDPDETHVLVKAVDSTGGNGQIWDNTTAVPNQGNFSGTTLHQDAANAEHGSFSSAPGGKVVYANQKEVRIWGGDEMGIAGFLLVRDPGEDAADYWGQVYTNDSETYAVMSGATVLYIGANRRINQVKVYIGTANASASIAGVSEYVYPGASWVSVSGMADGTSAGGKSLAQTGTISWDYNTSTRATFVGDGDQLAYWYKFTFPGVDAGTAIYYITCGEGQFRPLENLWDGVPSFLAAAFYTKSGTSEYTDELNDDTPLLVSAADLETFTTSDELVLGFPSKQRGFILDFVNGHFNANASGVSVQEWNGDVWSGVTGLYDGTDDGGATFGENGIIHWIPSEERSVASIEAPRKYGSTSQLYFYRVTVSANLTDDVQPYFCQGIPAVEAKNDFKAVDRYRIPIEYQGRLFLLGHEREPNKGTYSAFEAPDVFNGSDSGNLYFGSREKITGAGVIYNVFLSTGFEQLIVTKASETYRLYGDGPENWEKQQMSVNVGNVAPASFAVCEIADVAQNVKRNVAIWQASHGFVMCDGATLQTISEDIACYFDENDDRQINATEISDTVGWYDPSIEAYKALITSGEYPDDEWGGNDVWHDEESNEWGVDWDNAQTTHNVELEYSLKYKQWTKIQRSDSAGDDLGLQTAFQVRDTEGRIYVYGAADDGNMYRTEYGRTWDAAPIEQYVKTKNLLLDGQNSMQNFTTLRRFRLLFEPKMSALAGEEIQVDHYGDNTLSVAGGTGQSLFDDIDMADADGRNSQTVTLGPYLQHALKFSASTTHVDDGMELSGFITIFDTHDRWRSD
jgi:hypothetical protein